MAKIFQQFQSVKELADAPLPKVGAALLAHIKSAHSQRFAIANLCDEVADQFASTSPYYQGRDEVFRVVHEAMEWARQNLLIMPDPTQPTGSGWMTLTRAGHAFKAETDLPLLELRRILSGEILHPTIREASYDIFMTGRFEAAVFEAFKTIEICVRDAAGYTADHYGTDMISRAFNSTKGPLTDSSAPASEREAMQRLMSGAHGVFKSPRSHRKLDLNDPIEAAEMLIIASHLIRIIELRNRREKS